MDTKVMLSPFLTSVIVTFRKHYALVLERVWLLASNVWLLICLWAFVGKKEEEATGLLVGLIPFVAGLLIYSAHHFIGHGPRRLRVRHYRFGRQ
jgi:hypothetical protein